MCQEAKIRTIISGTEPSHFQCLCLLTVNALIHNSFLANQRLNSLLTHYQQFFCGLLALVFPGTCTREFRHLLCFAVKRSRCAETLRTYTSSRSCVTLWLEHAATFALTAACSCSPTALGSHSSLSCFCARACVVRVSSCLCKTRRECLSQQISSLDNLPRSSAIGSLPPSHC